VQEITISQNLMAYVKRADNEPDNALLQYAAGEICLQIGNCTLAQKYFENSLQLEPEHIDSYRGLAICMVQNKECETGLRMCFNLLRWEPLDYTSRLLTAQVHIAFELYNEAIEYYSEASAIEYEARNYMIWQYERVLGKSIGKGRRLAKAITQKFPEYKDKLSNGGVHE
jgi:tetratricopeptide (TPR) repeat protein